jgi:uncharacterized protein (TIGR00369 family)
MEKKKQATSTNCFVCGVENPAGLHMHFYNTSPGVVEADYTVSEQFNGYPGIVHGGIIASMLDEAMGRVFMEDDPTRFMVTGEMKIRYRKPVQVNTALKITGRKVKDTGRIGSATGEIIGPDGEVLVTGEIIVFNKPGPKLSEDELADMGWKVYPEKVSI